MSDIKVDDNTDIDGAVNKRLSSAEHSGSDTDYGTGGSESTDDPTSSVKDGENNSTPNPAWTDKFTGKGASSDKGGLGNALAKFKSSGASAFAMKAGAPVFVVGALVAAVIVITMLFSSASGLLVTIAQKAVEETMNAAPAITLLRGIQLQQERLANVKSESLSGICGKVITIKCKLSTFSNDDIKAMQREGIEVKTKTGTFWDELKGRGRQVITDVKIGNTLYNNEGLAKAIRTNDSTVVSKMTSALEPRWKTFTKNSFYKVLAKFGGIKGVNIESSADRATIEQRLVDRVSGLNSALDNLGLEKMKDGDEYKDPVTNEKYIKGTPEFNDYVASRDVAYGKIQKVKNQLKISGDKIGKFAAQNSVKVVAVGVGIIQIGCAAWNVIRTAQTVAAQSGMQSMMAYANIFLNQASAIRAGEGQEDVVNYLSNMIMSKNSAGMTGMDSRAGKQLMYSEQSPLPETTYADPENPTAEEQQQAILNSEITDYTAGATMGPELLTRITDAVSIKTDSPDWVKEADRNCSIINSPIVSNLMLGAGIAVLLGCVASALVPIAGEVTLGGCAADIAIQAGTLGAIMGVMISLQHLLSLVSGTLTTGRENGPQAVAAFTVGTEGIGYNTGTNVGLGTGTPEQATEFKDTVINPSIKTFADADRQQYAWYDTSSTNTLLGSITSKLYPTFASMSSSTNALQFFGSLGSILSTPLSLFSSEVSAQTPSKSCGSTIYPDKALSQNCTPLAVTSSDVLAITGTQSVDYLLAHNEIDDSGAPIGPRFTEYIKYCSSEREAVVGMTLEGEIADDVNTGRICDASYDKADAETYRNIQAYMQVISGTSDVEIFSDGTTTPVPDPTTPTPPNGGGLSSYGNGKIPLSALAPISSVGLSGCSHAISEPYLAKSALTSLKSLSDAYTSAMGHGLGLQSCYRSYAQQVIAQKCQYNACNTVAKARKVLGDDTIKSAINIPAQAADPGSSNHGQGGTIDITLLKYGGNRSKEYKWLKAHASDYGWATGTVSGEPWHIKYTGTLQ